MIGLDWNQNGTHDFFDDFMDMQVTSDVFDDEGTTTTYEPTHTDTSAKTESESLFLIFLKFLVVIAVCMIAIAAIYTIPVLIISDIDWGFMLKTLADSFATVICLKWLICWFRRL